MTDIHDEHSHGILPVPVSDQITRIVCIALDTSGNCKKVSLIGNADHILHWAVENVLKSTDLVLLLHTRNIPSVPGPFGKL
jgi:hypothetical protein